MNGQQDHDEGNLKSGAMDQKDSRAANAVTYFDSKENEWMSTDGRPVCQDHNNYLPCPHRHGRKQ
jgi:hypothetical protein